MGRTRRSLGVAPTGCRGGIARSDPPARSRAYFDETCRCEAKAPASHRPNLPSGPACRAAGSARSNVATPTANLATSSRSSEPWDCHCASRPPRTVDDRGDRETARSQRRFHLRGDVRGISGPRGGAFRSHAHTNRLDPAPPGGHVSGARPRRRQEVREQRRRSTAKSRTCPRTCRRCRRWSASVSASARASSRWKRRSPRTVNASNRANRSAHADPRPRRLTRPRPDPPSGYSRP